MSRMFTNGLGDQGSIPGQVIPKTQKMVLDSALLSTQYYKVRIKVKVEQSREWSSPFSLHHGVIDIEKGAFRSPTLLFIKYTLKLKTMLNWAPSYQNITKPSTSCKTEFWIVSTSKYLQDPVPQVFEEYWSKNYAKEQLFKQINV